MALSGVTAARGSPPRGLARIAKPSSASLAYRLRDHALDARQRRRLGHQPREEAIHRLGGGLDLDHHAARVVQDMARHAELAGQPVDVRAEADPLDGSLDARADAAQATSSRSTW